MTSLQLFSFNNQSVRVISVDGDPWFVAQDVLTAIKSTTTVTASKTVIENELGEEFVSNTPLQTSGGIQDFTIFAEFTTSLYLAGRDARKSLMLYEGMG